MGRKAAMRLHGVHGTEQRKPKALIEVSSRHLSKAAILGVLALVRSVLAWLAIGSNAVRCVFNSCSV